MTDQSPIQVSDSFRWLDSSGFEHISTIRAESWERLAYALAEAEGGILEVGGKPLISANLRPTNEPLPRADAPETGKVQERDETGTPVVDGNGKAVMIDLPDGTHLFTVKEVFHDTNQGGDRHMLKVVLEEQSYAHANGKYGISCFHPESHFPKWKQWEVGKRYAPPATAAKVVIRDPKPGGKFADVVEFREG